MHDPSPAPFDPAMPAGPAVPSSTGRSKVLAGSRRTVASLFLAAGLMATGGVAVVNAASPAPSPAASGAPSGGPGGAGGSGTHTGNCPGM
jgi:hypothetical protein